MAVSGTSTFALKIDELIEEAFERVGINQPTGGDLRSARRSLNLLLQEMANRGELLWATETHALAVPAGYAQVPLPADTLSVGDVTVRRTGSTESELYCRPIGVAEYRLLPNKYQTGRPLLWVLNRERDAPTLTLWPVPDAACDLVVERRRRLMDVGDYDATLDLPMRFVPAVVSGLAWALAEKRPAGVPSERRTELLARWESELQSALYEDRERVSLTILPDLGR